MNIFYAILLVWFGVGVGLLLIGLCKVSGDAEIQSEQMLSSMKKDDTE